MKLFMSYSRMDLPFARVLYKGLELAGLKPWLDVIDIPSHSDWTEEIKNAIDTCEIYLLIISPWALRSEAVCGEWSRASEKEKITLLLVLQGVDTDDLLKALDHTEMATQGKEAQKLFNSLSWIDIRSHPEKAVDSLMAWIGDKSLCQHGKLPSPIHPALMLFENIPNSARISAFAYIGFGIAGILLLIVYITQVINQHMSLSLLSLGTTSMIGRFIPFYVMFFKKLIVMSSILFIIWFGIHYPECVINGIKIFRRNSSLSFKWIPVFTIYFQSAICLAISINTEYTTMFSMKILLSVGIASMFLGTFMLLSVRRMKHSPFLSMWLPAESRRTPKRGMRKMLSDPIRAQHPLFIPIKSDMPLNRVFLLYARPDARFIEPLIKYLQARGIISETLPNLIASCQAVIIVLSPWLNENIKLGQIWKLALDDRMPIIPLLLQDAELPLELRHLNWIDARSDPGKAYEEVASLLKGQASLVSYHVPHYAPKRDAPLSVIFIGLSIMLASGLKVLLAGVVFPFSLWFYPNLLPSHWVAAGILLALGYLQFLSMNIFIYRKISYYLMIVVQSATMILGWICSYNIASVTTSFSLISPSLIIILDGIGLGAIVCAPYIRQWAPGGLFLRIRPFHSGKHETRVVNYIVTLTFTVIALLIPGISASRENIYRQGAVLVNGQPVLGRFGKKDESHRWILSSQRGDSITIIAEGITIGFKPDISLYDDKGNEIASGEIDNFQQEIINYNTFDDKLHYIKIKPMYSGEGKNEVYRLTAIKNKQS